MKAEILGQEEKKTFVPFTMKLTVSNIGEARLLYHVFNRFNLLSALESGAGYEIKKYSDGIADDLDMDYDFLMDLSGKITGMGFDL